MGKNWTENEILIKSPGHRKTVKLCRNSTESHEN